MPKTWIFVKSKKSKSIEMKALSENDTFTEKPEYEVVLIRSDNEVRIYCTVCIETVIYDEFDWHFLFYCHPESGEVIYSSQRIIY